MAIRNLSNQKLVGGYVPTLEIIANIISVELKSAFYTTNGQCVQVYGVASVLPTVGGLYTFRASLPVGMEFTAIEDCIGIAGTQNWGNVGGIVRAHLATNEASIESYAGAGLVDCYFHFAYIVR